MTRHCGRCLNDRGLLVALLGPYLTAKKELVYHCSFCGVERHPGGSHLRVHLVTGGKHQGEEEVIHIPHLVAAA